jgi:hypothetical protein
MTDLSRSTHCNYTLDTATDTLDKLQLNCNIYVLTYILYIIHQYVYINIYIYTRYIYV